MSHDTLSNRIVLRQLFDNPKDNFDICFNSLNETRIYLDRGMHYLQRHLEQKSYLVSTTDKQGRQITYYVITQVGHIHIEEAGSIIKQFYMTKKSQTTKKQCNSIITFKAPNHQEKEKREKIRQSTCSILKNINLRYKSLVDAANHEDCDFKKLQELMGA